MQLPATLPAHLHRTVHRVGRAIIDGVLPPRCLACGVAVDEPDALCATCWNAMTFLRRAVVRGMRTAVRASDGGGGGLRRLRREQAAAGTGRAR